MEDRTNLNIIEKKIIICIILYVLIKWMAYGGEKRMRFGFKFQTLSNDMKNRLTKRRVNLVLLYD